MKVRALFPLAAATGFWLAGPALAQQPATLPASVANPNQTLADSVANKLRAIRTSRLVPKSPSSPRTEMSP